MFILAVAWLSKIGCFVEAQGLSFPNASLSLAKIIDTEKTLFTICENLRFLISKVVNGECVALSITIGPEDVME